MKGTACIFNVNHIDSDNSRNVAIDIAATESIDNRAAIEVERDITVDIGSNLFINKRCRWIIHHSLRAGKDFLIVAAIEVQGDVGIVLAIRTDESLVGAAVKLANRTDSTQDVGGDATVVVGSVGTAEHLAIDLVGAAAQRRVARTGHGEVDGIDIARFVGTAIHLVDKTGIHRGVGRTPNVRWSPPFTVATTNNLMETSTFDKDVGVGTNHLVAIFIRI